MAEVLELKVKSNIKGVVKEVDDLTQSLQALKFQQSELNQSISAQNSYIHELRDKLIKLKAAEDAIPKGAFWYGRQKNNELIRETSSELKLQINDLKQMKVQQAENNAAIKEGTAEQKSLSDAKKKGTPISNAAAVAVRGIGAAMKAMGIGLIISAFLLLKKALMSNEQVMKAVKKITVTLSNAISDVVTVLVDTYNWVTESSARFDDLGKVIVGLINLAFTPFKLTLYAVMLTVQELILKFYQMKNAIPGKNETANINAMNASISKTRKNLRETASGAVAAFKSVVSSAGGALTEFKDIAGRVREGLSEFTVDTIDRNKELVESEGKTAKEIEDIAQKLMDFKQRLAEQQASREEQTELEKIAAAREAHLAELDALAINAEEKARLEQEINAMYDAEKKDAEQVIEDEAQAIKDEEAAELKAIEDENMLLEIEDLRERALKKLEIQREADILAVADHDNRLAMEKAIDAKYDKAAKKLDKEELKWKDITTKQKIGMAEGAFGDMATILGKETAAGKAAAIALVAPK